MAMTDPTTQARVNIKRCWDSLSAVPGFSTVAKQLKVRCLIGQSARAVVALGFSYRRFKFISRMDNIAFSRAVQELQANFFKPYTPPPEALLSSSTGQASAASSSQTSPSTLFTQTQSVKTLSKKQSAATSSASSSTQSASFHFGIFSFYSCERVPAVTFFIPKNPSAFEFTQRAQDHLFAKVKKKTSHEMNFATFLAYHSHESFEIKKRFEQAFFMSVLNNSSLRLMPVKLIQAMIAHPFFQRLEIKSMAFYGSWVRKILANKGAPNDFDLRIELSDKQPFDAQAFRQMLFYLVQSCIEGAQHEQSLSCLEISANTDPTQKHWSFTCDRFNVVVQRGSERTYTDRVEGLEFVWNSPWLDGFLSQGLANFVLLSKAGPIDEVMDLLRGGLIEIQRAEEITAHGMSRLLWKLMEANIPLDARTLMESVAAWKHRGQDDYEQAIRACFKFFSRKGSFLGTLQERWLTSLINLYTLIGYDVALVNDSTLLSLLRSWMRKDLLDVRFGSELEHLRRLCETKSPHEVQDLLNLLANSFQLNCARHPRSPLTSWTLSTGTSILLVGTSSEDWRFGFSRLTDTDMGWLLDWVQRQHPTKKKVTAPILARLAKLFLVHQAPYTLRCDCLEALFEKNDLLYLWENIFMSTEDRELANVVWKRLLDALNQTKVASQVDLESKELFEAWMKDKRVKRLAYSPGSCQLPSALPLVEKEKGASLNESVSVDSWFMSLWRACSGLTVEKSDEWKLLVEKAILEMISELNVEQVIGYVKDPFFCSSSLLFQLQMLLRLHTLAHQLSCEPTQIAELIEPSLAVLIEQGNEQEVIDWLQKEAVLDAPASVRLFSKVFKRHAGEAEALTVRVAQFEAVFERFQAMQTSDYLEDFKFFPVEAVSFFSDAYLSRLGLKGIVSILKGTELTLGWKEKSRLVQVALNLLPVSAATHAKASPSFHDVLGEVVVEMTKQAKTAGEFAACRDLVACRGFDALKGPYKFLAQLALIQEPEAGGLEKNDQMKKAILAQLPRINGSSLEAFILSEFWPKLSVEERRVHLERYVASCTAKVRLREGLLVRILEVLPLNNSQSPLWPIVMRNGLNLLMKKSEAHRQVALAIIKNQSHEYAKVIIDYLKDYSEEGWNFFEAMEKILPKIELAQSDLYLALLAHLPSMPSIDRALYDRAWKAVKGLFVRRRSAKSTKLPSIDSCVMQQLAKFIGTFVDYQYFVDQVLMDEIKEESERSPCRVAAKEAMHQLHPEHGFKVAMEIFKEPGLLVQVRLQELLLGLIECTKDKQQETLLNALLVASTKSDVQTASTYLELYLKLRKDQLDANTEKVIDLWKRCFLASTGDQTSSRDVFFRDWLTTQMSRSLHPDKLKKLCEPVYAWLLQLFSQPVRPTGSVCKQKEAASSRSFESEGLDEAYFHRLFLLLRYALYSPVNASITMLWRELADEWVKKLLDGSSEAFPRFRSAGAWMELILFKGLYTPLEEEDVLKLKTLSLTDHWTETFFISVYAALSPYLQRLLRKADEAESGVAEVSILPGLADNLSGLPIATDQSDKHLGVSTNAHVAAAGLASSVVSPQVQAAASAAALASSHISRRPVALVSCMAVKRDEKDDLPLPPELLKREDASSCYFFYLYDAIIRGQLPWTIAHIQYLNTMKMEAITPTDRSRLANIKSAMNTFLLTILGSLNLDKLQKLTSSNSEGFSEDLIDDIFSTLGVVENRALRAQPLKKRCARVQKYLNPHVLLEGCRSEALFMEKADWEISSGSILRQFKRWLELMPDSANLQVRALQDFARLDTKFKGRKPQLKKESPWLPLLITFAEATACCNQTQIFLNDVLPLFDQTSPSYHHHLLMLVANYPWSDQGNKHLFFIVLLHMIHQHAVARNAQVNRSAESHGKEFQKFISSFVLLKKQINSRP